LDITQLYEGRFLAREPAGIGRERRVGDQESCVEAVLSYRSSQIPDRAWTDTPFGTRSVFRLDGDQERNERRALPGEEIDAAILSKGVAPDPSEVIAEVGKTIADQQLELIGREITESVWRCLQHLKEFPADIDQFHPRRETQAAVRGHLEAER
jgi:hypothetical protein